MSEETEAREGGDKRKHPGRIRPLEMPPPVSTHSPGQEVVGRLSFRPEVTRLQQICPGGVLAGEQGQGEKEWLGQNHPLLPCPALP